MPGRTIGGLPLIVWVGAIGAGIFGFWWVKKRSTSTGSTSPGTKAATPSFTQAQEVQDFQIFSALTGAQQASDLNFLSEVAGLFSGGTSTGTGGSGGGVPSPPSTGTTPPATTSQQGWAALSALTKQGYSQAQIQELGAAQSEANALGYGSNPAYVNIGPPS